MAQLSDDCFAFGGPMMSVDEAVGLIAARVTGIKETETVALGDADGRLERVLSPSDLAPNDYEVALRVSFTGDPAPAVLPQAGVEDSVGNGVANFVRMTFANGFGSKNETTEHGNKG